MPSAKLSKNLLKMKFMKRALNEDINQKETDDYVDMDRSNPNFWILRRPNTNLASNSNKRLVVKKLFKNNQRRIFPRYSSFGFNADVETLCQQNKNKYLQIKEKIKLEIGEISEKDQVTNDLYDQLVKKLANQVEKRQKRRIKRKRKNQKNC